MNIFQRFITRPESAIARWRQHYAQVKESVHSEDRKIRNTFEKLAAADRSAKDLVASDPSLENLIKSVDAGARRIAAKQTYEHYCNTAGMELHVRVEKALDLGIASSAAKELRKFIETQKEKAAADAAKFAEENGLDLVETKKAIEARFSERLLNVTYAENCLANTKISSPERKIYPSGLNMFNDYIEAAVGGN